MFSLRVGSIFLLGLALLPNWANAQDSIAACPRDVHFWADQCEGFSSEICPDGMQHLARQVINRSIVVEWKRSDGSFETRTDFMALSDSALVTALCAELQDRADPRDRAEAEYVALLLNVSVGALPLDASISSQIEGTIGHLVDSYEEALNRNSNLDTWQQIVEQVNLGNIDAPECPDPDQIFRHVSPCGD